MREAGAEERPRARVAAVPLRVAPVAAVAATATAPASNPRLLMFPLIAMNPSRLSPM
ncbi:hypothetical protein OG978_22295 [Streptomyces sp. NBC_01591]|uniref:hypothetical protein n=1 Tax=Streptomyces sp. NBC_01591 TaxID=2975888 RepID=UPI002DD9F195|nr:hypothetical protein [Streptomyces sp. NBC_01591]WSD69864.1 hypothetical protein OG978_22295 [Streptomyces sp. NBC_01591]